MKNYQILLALATIVVLIALDGQAAGEDGLAMYGWLMRGVVWLIIFVNGIVFYEGVRAYTQE